MIRIQHNQSTEGETEGNTAAKYATGTILACFLECYADEEPQLGG